MDHVFVALPGGADSAGSYEKTFLRDADGRKVREVLWGDWLTLAPDMPQTGDWRWIRWACRAQEGNAGPEEQMVLVQLCAETRSDDGSGAASRTLRRADYPRPR